MKFTNYFFDELIHGNASVITSKNISKLNEIALDIYRKEELNSEEIKSLREIIMSCNILYNRTDMSVLPIEDGFYDLLLEKYKKYDSNFQVGSAIVLFKNMIENDLENPKKIASSPIIFNDKIKRNEIRQEMYENIMRIGKPILNKHDFDICPIEFNNSYISKRTHNTEHHHPSLIGTLDKCKFIFNNDAINMGCFDDNNVKILERDFFQDHIKKGIISPNQIINVVAELKYDGISVEGDCGLELISARTRGDTGIGEAADITPILKGYPFKHAGCMIGENPIGVKFEAIITKSDLEEFNRLRNRNYRNCRTAIVGLFGSSDAYMFRNLITLIPLALDRDDIPSITNRMEEIEFLNKVFASNGEPLRYCYMSGTVSEILYMIKAFWDEAKIARDYLNFMYDGIVISYLDEDIRQRLGRKNFINKFSMAVKFDPLEKQTIFRGYTYEVGQHGQITPMIHYDPVEFFGTIHTKSTGSSFERFQNLNLRYGDYINVTYVNDVMPYVSNLDCESNRKNAEDKNPVPFISRCPICKTELVCSGKMYYCPNNNCSGRSLKRMTNMLKKLNIKGFSDASISSLGVYSLSELYNLSMDYMISRLGEVDGRTFFEALQSLKINPVKDYIVMGSIGFTSIAHKKWKLILSQITLKQLYYLYTSISSDSLFQNAVDKTDLDKDATTMAVMEKLKLLVPNIGDITSLVVAREFKFFLKDIEFIINNFNIIDSLGDNYTNELQIRFTGVRNKQLSELLCNAGYDADDSSSVTKKTDILLVPYDGFSSNKTRKVSDKCKIIPIDIFIDKLNKYINENGEVSVEDVFL